MTPDTLIRAMLGLTPADRAAQLIDGCNKAIQLANLNTVNRVAMFLAQLGEESGSLKYTEEIASGAEYEGRADLGNTQPGDGVRFKGRSFIQITGRANYTAFSKWAHAKGLTSSDDYFVKNPTALANDEFAWIGAVWYWTQPHYRDSTPWRYLNDAADHDDVVGATYIVNGGQNGIEDRKHRYSVCKALGNKLLEEVDEVTPEDLAKIEAIVQKHRTGLFDDLRTMVRNAFGAFITHKPKGWFTHKSFPAAVHPQPQQPQK